MSLTTWFKEDWVDIGSKKKGGGYKKCGRSKQKRDAKRKYPKCVPLAKARRMSAAQIKSAVSRKRKAQRKVTLVENPSMLKLLLNRFGASINCKSDVIRGVAFAMWEGK